ncbi:hypothetical protein KQX54_014883 [Cotesia glomerata]|uniref:Uncharacterized protein n=1 Tax=Cotesia glomerata TaxID=32391 RepID=A0AAV7ISU4_COTGL|nr:hypothetical protein KQX54_014883 [Cotesia glomerata]
MKNQNQLPEGENQLPEGEDQLSEGEVQPSDDECFEDNNENDDNQIEKDGNHGDADIEEVEEEDDDILETTPLRPKNKKSQDTRRDEKNIWRGFRLPPKRPFPGLKRAIHLRIFVLLPP